MTSYCRCYAAEPARRAVTAGQNSPLAAVVQTRDGQVFVKGLPSGHRLAITQAREAAAAPLAKGISPELLWQFDEAGWNVLGFEYIQGRAAHGHTIKQAEAHAARLPAYAAADPAHINVFARANVNMWNEIEGQNPIQWVTMMAHAARAWARHREPCAN